VPRVARPAPSDRAPSPFESLIDETSQPAEPVPPQSESKAVASDDKQAPAKSKDCKATEPTEDTKPENIGEVTAAGETPATDESPAEIGGKKIAKPKTVDDMGDSVQPETDPAPAAGNGKKSDDANAATPTDGAVTVVNSDAIAIVPTPAETPSVSPDDGKPVEQPLQQLALMADAKLKIKQPGDDLPKSAAAKKAGDSKQADTSDQVDTDQPSIEPDDVFEMLSKDARSKPTESKPQTGPGDGDKQHVLQSRGDIVANIHRPDADGSIAAGGADIGGTAKVSADAAAQLSVSGTASHSSQNIATPAAPTLQPNPQPVAVPLSGVAIEIAGKALAGKNRFEIRLDPPELGRIEVRLDVDRDGNVTSRLTVDRQDTLDLLRRDAAGLERALQDAGLKTANNGLQFSLRDQSMNGQQQAGTSPGAAMMVATDESLPGIDVIPQQYRLAGQGGGLDIRV
jgi:flagellar hook-length control protein FliK